MQTVRDIEFVSYDGAWPCLCMGTLTLKVEGKEVKMKGGLCSGGTCCCGFDGDADEVTEGDWTVDFECWPVEFSELEQKIVTDLLMRTFPTGAAEAVYDRNPSRKNPETSRVSGIHPRGSGNADH